MKKQNPEMTIFRTGTFSGFLSVVLFIIFFGICSSAQAQRNQDEATLFVDNTHEMVRINKNIYGHFSEHLGGCIYGGFWVGEDSEIPNTRGIRNDVVNALRKLDIPVLRWPGGCFADMYHWRDGIGPREQRPDRINSFWGDVIEPNHFGTHEFLDLCEQLGAEPYIAGNVGSGTPTEMHDWVEYMTYPGDSKLANMRQENGREEPWQIPFFGVGNENWGCGGNMTPEFYADLYKRFATYVMNYGDNRIYKIASGAGSDNYRWTEVLMQQAARDMNGLSLHYYTVTGNWSNKGSAVNFTEQEWFTNLRKGLRVDDILARHIAIMDQYDPEKRVGLMVDEWGTWHDAMPGTNPSFLRQQNTLRDALLASTTLDIFHKYADRVRMANIAQTVNVLQAMILTDGPEMFVTPTYHVFEMYKVHQDAMLLDSHLDTPSYSMGDESIPQVSASASRDENGRIHISLSNVHPDQEVPVSVELRDPDISSISGRVLTAEEMNAHNDFDRKNRVTPKNFRDVQQTGRGFEITLPPKSVVVIELDT